MWLLRGFLCGSPRLCWLRTKGFIPVSKYWTYRSHAGDMSPVSLVVYHRQMLGLSALLQWLCWERNWGGSHGPLSRAERWSREHFSRDQCIRPTLLMTHEKLPRTGTARRKRTLGVCGLVWESYMSCWSGFPLQGVHRFESPRLTDMSNRLILNYACALL
jgi:hypothetical protein